MYWFMGFLSENMGVVRRILERIILSAEQKLLHGCKHHEGARDSDVHDLTNGDILPEDEPSCYLMGTWGFGCE